MKNKKLIIILSIIFSMIVVAIFAILILKSTQNNKIEFDNDKYISKGQFFEKIVREYNLSSDKYSSDEIKNSEDYNTFANVLVEWQYVTKEQTKNLSNPLTRELAAYIMVNSVGWYDTFKIEISDIDDCENKQMIMDSVGMGIFKLEDKKFNPYGYVEYEEVNTIIENAKVYAANYQIDSSKENQEESKFDNLKISINNKEYTYPFGKVSDFIEAGWQVEEEEYLNKSIKDLYSSEEAGQDMLYIGFNYLTLKQDNILMNAYFDTSNKENKILDSQIIHFTITKMEENKETNVNFFGFNLNDVFEKDDFKDIFGNKNIQIVSDTDEIEYSKYLNVNDKYNVNIILKTDIKTNKLIEIEVG